jgi:hypothetical protein
MLLHAHRSALATLCLSTHSSLVITERILTNPTRSSYYASTRSLLLSCHSTVDPKISKGNKSFIQTSSHASPRSSLVSSIAVEKLMNPSPRLHFYKLIAPLLPLLGRPTITKGKQKNRHADFLLCLATLLARFSDCNGETKEIFLQTPCCASRRSSMIPRIAQEKLTKLSPRLATIRLHACRSLLMICKLARPSNYMSTQKRPARILIYYASKRSSLLSHHSSLDHRIAREKLRKPALRLPTMHLHVHRPSVATPRPSLELQ